MKWNHLYAFILGFSAYFICLGALDVYNDYAGMMLNVIFLGMITSIFLIALIAEILSLQRITKIYFWGMGGIWIASILGFLLFDFQF